MAQQDNPIKILFVDDEQIVRNGLSMTIDWAANGFEVIGTASNGEKALSLCRETAPDLVVTDIKMPVMDGLELTKRLVERFPAVKIILLSAYDEFKYAQQALSLGASEYILKAELDCDDLLATALRLGKDILVQRREQSSADHLAMHLTNHTASLQTNLLWRLLTEPCNLRELEHQFPEYAIHLRPEQLLLLHLWLPKAFRLPKDWDERLQHAFENVYQVQSSPEHIVVVANGKLHWAVRDLRLVLTGLANGLAALGGGAVRLYASELFAGYHHLRPTNSLLLEHARRDLFYGLPAENPQLCSRPLEAGAPGDLSSILQEIVACAGQDLYPQLEKAAHRMFEILQEARYSPDEARERVYIVCVILLEKARSLDSPAQEELLRIQTAFSGGISFKQAVYQFNRLSELREAATRFVEDTVAYILRNLYSYSKIVNKAIGYISRHLSQEITLNNVAQDIYCNPVYLSQVFKQETGQNFSKYLALTRIKHAKFLLVTTELSISQVAEAVGIPNPSYFSKVFAKVAGMRPNQFRMQAADSAAQTSQKPTPPAG